MESSSGFNEDFPPLSSLKKALPPTKSNPSPNSSLPSNIPPLNSTTTEARGSGEVEAESAAMSGEESEDGESEEEEDEMVDAATTQRMDAVEENMAEFRREVLKFRDMAESAVRKADESEAAAAELKVLVDKHAERVLEVELEGRASQEQVELLNQQLKKERAQFKQRTGVMQARIKFLEYELEKALREK